jgi:transcriptional regulator with XRE-family HTH domain
MSEQPEAPARRLYNRLRTIQIENGWTNKQLAERAGISRNTIDNWKTQPRSPLPTTVKDVATRLGIPYAEALDLAGIELEDSPISRQLASRVAEHSDRMHQLTERTEGTVRLTLDVYVDGPEPETPPEGLRTQSERIIWAMTDDPWPVRAIRILAGRELEATLTDAKPTNGTE